MSNPTTCKHGMIQTQICPVCYADEIAALRAKLAEAEKREQGALSSLYVALADKDAAEKRLANAEEREKKLKREIGIRRWMAASGEGYYQPVTDWDGADQKFRDDYLAGLACKTPDEG